MSDLTIIIPTACRLERAAVLRRAIDSAIASCETPPNVAVVANGPNVDESLYRSLIDDERVQVFRLEKGSVPLAQAYGRRQVDTPFFAFLDDDDELLAGASDLRLARLRSDAAIDLVVMNGSYMQGGKTMAMHPNLQAIEADPLKALLERNWLASCGGMFRTASIGEDYFAGSHSYAEWTWLAFRLSMDKKCIRVIDQPGYMVHDTPNSLSKSESYFESYISLFDRMLSAPVPAYARKRIMAKRCAAQHHLSVLALGAGELDQAWSSHRSSLQFPSGWKYALYGRKILWARLKKRLPRNLN